MVVISWIPIVSLHPPSSTLPLTLVTLGDELSARANRVIKVIRVIRVIMVIMVIRSY